MSIDLSIYLYIHIIYRGLTNKNGAFGFMFYQKCIFRLSARWVQRTILYLGFRVSGTPFIPSQTLLQTASAFVSGLGGLCKTMFQSV